VILPIDAVHSVLRTSGSAARMRHREIEVRILSRALMVTINSKSGRSVMIYDPG